jgi:hypothetical protein
MAIDDPQGISGTAGPCLPLSRAPDRRWLLALWRDRHQPGPRRLRPAHLAVRGGSRPERGAAIRERDAAGLVGSAHAADRGSAPPARAAPRGFPKNRSYFSTSKNRSSLFAVENVRPKIDPRSVHVRPRAVERGEAEIQASGDEIGHDYPTPADAAA